MPRSCGVRRPKFCTASRPLGKRARDGGATWLYGDADETGAVSAGASQNADDVAQGSLGDCYLLSALALATRDSAVCDDLIDDTYEDVGIYGVTLCVRGRWTMVWVDAHFPCWRPKMRTASTADLNQSTRRARTIGRSGRWLWKRRMRR